MFLVLTSSLIGLISCLLEFFLLAGIAPSMKVSKSLILLGNLPLCFLYPRLGCLNIFSELTLLGLGEISKYSGLVIIKWQYL